MSKLPAFSTPQYAAQCNLPPWDEVEASIRGIFSRRYFANGGPLVRSLDRAFAEFVGVSDAVCVTNETVGMMILAKALGLSGEVIVPAFAPRRLAQALTWAGLEPVPCDVDEATSMLSAETVRGAITNRTVAIAGVHVFGRLCDTQALQNLAARYRLALLFDAADAVRCSNADGRFAGSFGAGEVFSFHASTILNGAEGGCVTTNDASLASKLRTTRNFYVPAERVPLRINGKMAEAAAALTLLAIDHYESYLQNNLRRLRAYRRGLANAPGIRLLEYGAAARNNLQSIVIAVDPGIAGVTRDELLQSLAAENVFLAAPFGRAGRSGLPVADRLMGSLALLPNAQTISESDVDLICALLKARLPV